MPAAWRGTLGDALRASERAAPGKVAFVSAEWEQAARIRVSSADDLAGIAERLGSREPVYAVKSDGTIQNTATRRDEYLRVSPDDTSLDSRLQRAVQVQIQKDGARAGRPTPAQMEVPGF